MDESNKFPKRKSTRLKDFDYSSVGTYFVTICIQDRKQILSEIVRTDVTATEKTTFSAVGEGLAPPEYWMKLKPCGEVVREQLQLLENRFPSVSVEDYVIMPDHIHAIIFLDPDKYTERQNGSSRAPTPTNEKKRVVEGADPYQ